MAGYDGRGDLVPYASNYIVYEYPTIREYALVLIVIAAYSNSISFIRRECLP